MDSEKWQKVTRNSRRLKVFGGWVFEDWTTTNNGDRLAICFIPDPQHNWKLNENKTKEGE